MITKMKTLIEKLREKAKESSVKIFSLAPRVPEIKKGYSIYEMYLKQAFNNPTIKNIAITGNFGVGKSSFLTWFSRKKKYLFISLCNFKSNEKYEINSLELNLVQQLIIGCRSASRNKNRVRLSIYLLTFVFNILLAFFLLSINYMGSLDFLNNLYKNINLVSILETSKKYVYIFIALIYFLGLPFLFSNIVSLISLKKLSFKIAEIEAELEVENKQNFSFMDFHRDEVVTYLRNYSKKFDYTVIFEDMDRLNFDNCITIFSELREINRLVNMFPAKFNTSKKIIRFIYVIHDGIFELVNNSNENNNTEKLTPFVLNHLKFFDYIIPFIPLYLDDAASQYFKNCLNKIGFNCADEFVNIVGKYIYDYRTIQNIINEYCVMRDIYKNNEGNKINNSDEKHIMALSVYKTLMPDDYQKVRIGDSIIQKASETKNQSINQLISRNWLCWECLKYVGLSSTEMKNYIKELLTFNSEWHSKRLPIVQNVLKNKYILCTEVFGELSIQENVYNEIVEYYGYSLLTLEITHSECGFKIIKAMNKNIADKKKIKEDLTEEHRTVWKNFLNESFSNDTVNDNVIDSFEYLHEFSSCFSDFFLNIDDDICVYVFKCFMKLPLDCFENYLISIKFVQWFNNASKDSRLLNQLTDLLKGYDDYIKKLLDLNGLDEYVKNALQTLILKK